MYAQVVLEFATVKEIDRLFTYKIQDELTGLVKIGSRVKVPFGKGAQYKIGYVIQLEQTIEKQSYKIKNIKEVIEEEPILSTEQIKIATFISHYYGCSLAASISTLLPPGLSEKPLVYKPHTIEVIKRHKTIEEIKDFLSKNSQNKMYKGQVLVLQKLLQKEKIPMEELMQEEGVTKSPIHTLLKNGFIQKAYDEVLNSKSSIAKEKFKSLSIEQKTAYDTMKEEMKKGKGSTVLLKGVTGSGKTEVFLHTIRDTLLNGDTALVLVPEIALTKQTVARFTERFGNQVALTHSRMTPKERQDLYLKARKGEVSVVIGPRSAIFMPLPRLKLIVIDEEHESTYKSEVAPKYHAIDIAKYRMAYAGGVTLLASATPSFETYHEAQIGNIKMAELTQRMGSASFPSIEVVDMRLELKEGNHSAISRALYKQIEHTLLKGEQVMLLLNRRGHSTFVNCRGCGYVVKCAHCDIAMTYHSTQSQLVCHYCGAKAYVPKTCPTCTSPHIRFFGNGTEKVEAYLKEHFGNFGVGRMDFDTTSGKYGHEKVLEAFATRKNNILIGTQMIAKGHDFANVTLVGILAADQSLYMQDFRASEKAFQLLTQTLGRSGRADKKGRVIIQTYSPEHSVIGHVRNFKQEDFYQKELENRALMGYPPYTHLFSLMIIGANEEEVIKKAYLLSQYYQHYNKKGLFRVIGPSAARVGKVADEYRWKILILGDLREKVLIYGKYCLDKFLEREQISEVRVQWDIDPLQGI
jgi:primosomal protein N' (replication factor Y)